MPLDSEEIRVVVALVPRIVGEALAEVIGHERGIAVVAQAQTPLELLSAVAKHSANAVILGVEGSEPPPVASHLLAEFPSLTIVAIPNEPRTSYVEQLCPRRVEVELADLVSLAALLREAVEKPCTWRSRFMARLSNIGGLMSFKDNRSLYQVGGVTREELNAVIGKLRERGLRADYVSTCRDRFGRAAEEYAVLADDQGVLGLLSDTRINIGKVEWAGSMSTEHERQPSEPIQTLYPDHVPLTKEQADGLTAEKAMLYRVGGLSRGDLENLVTKLRKQKIGVEIVKDAGNRFQGPTREFTVKTNEQGVLGLLSDKSINVGVC